MTEIKSAAEIKKKCVLLGFEDVLVPGEIGKGFELGPVREILENLSRLEERFSGFRFFAITGLAENKARKKVKDHGLEGLLGGKRMFVVDDRYIASKKEMDRKLYVKHIKEDPGFKDEFLKQVVISKMKDELGYKKPQIAFVGHDVWTEGFYTRRFSEIDFAIVEESASSLGKKMDKKIRGIVYVKRNWSGLERVLRWQETPDYSDLDKFVFDTMKERLFEGTKLRGLAKLAK